MNWEERREYFIKRLIKEHEENRVDEDIYELLTLFNSFPQYYTLSSCSGRIQIIQAKNPSKRKDLVSIAKFHSKITLEDLSGAINKIKGSNAWISLQPPIIHVACRTLEDALKLIKIARASGFKHSGIQAKNPDRYVVELNCSGRLDIPLKYNDKLLINLNELNSIVEMLNEHLEEVKSRISKLYISLKTIFEESK